MNLRRNLFLVLAMATAAAVPVMGQTHSAAAPIPDFSGVWQHPAFPWFEPPASGPGPITNLSRWPEQQSGDSLAGSLALPPSKTGISDYDQLVGDYKSPILQPWASAVVKQYGEISLAGVTYGNPSNQCWPFPVPFIYKQFIVQLVQQPDRITMLYSSPDHEFRQVRLNQRHPANVKPSWYGDSVGHYEGDTLVIDTVGIKADRPYGMIDLFGTPYTDRLHVVERFRLRDYDEVKDAIERNRKENWLFSGDVWRGYRGKFLQLHITIEDAGVFTTPWTATLTYVPMRGDFPESVCAENPREYYNNRDADLPKADKPDF